jgi:hypothetical protein
LQSETTRPFRDAGDAVMVAMSRDGLRSSVPLPFYPGEADPADPTMATFAEAETIELAGRDLTKVLASYEQLAESADPAVRAGALVRVGRVARRTGKADVALAAYDKLARLGPTTPMGRPADLLASHTLVAINRQARRLRWHPAQGRCIVVARLGRGGDPWGGRDE